MGEESAHVARGKISLPPPHDLPRPPLNLHDTGPDGYDNPSNLGYFFT